MTGAITQGKLREFAKAREALLETTLPATRLINACDIIVAELRTENKRLQSQMDSMRPHWAEGHTSDSVAAQAKTIALSQVWGLLGVDNQTACMDRLRELMAGIEPEPKNTAYSLTGNGPGHPGDWA